MTERWTYEPCGDSDGEMIGTDHFVIDEKGDEIACPRNEKQARLIAAAPDLLASLENLAGIITTIREEQVSSKMGLGRTEAEKRERACFVNSAYGQDVPQTASPASVRRTRQRPGGMKSATPGD